MAKEDTQVAVIDPTKYALISASNEINEIKAALQENLAPGESLRASDLTTIHAPTAGGSTFSMKTLAGKINFEAVDGVVIHQNPNRQYHIKSFAETGASAPDCYSPDGTIGIGCMAASCNGICANCAMSQFTQGANGENVSPLCKQYLTVFMMREDDVLPTLLMLPRTSLKPFRTYKIDLGKERRGLSSVITRFFLDSQDFGKYKEVSVIKPKMIALLPPEITAKFKAYGEEMESFFAGLSATVDAQVLSGAVEDDGTLDADVIEEMTQAKPAPPVTPPPVVEQGLTDDEVNAMDPDSIPGLK